MRNNILQRSISRRIAIMLLLVIPLYGTAQEDGDDVVIGTYKKFESNILSQERSYLVHLPADYEKSGKK